MSEIISYLHKLKFDPKLENSLIAKYLRNNRLVLLIVFLLITVGITSYLSLPRVLNPSINIPIVIVSTVLPGAGSNDIESLVTIPLEDSLNNLTRVKTISSVSADSASVITLEFESGVDPDKAQSDVQSAVSTVATLPKDAKTPQVQKLDFENVPVWTFTVSSGQDEASLMRFSRSLRDSLKDVPTIDKVDISGLDEQEIQVLIKPQAIATYDINPMALSQTIAAAIGAIPAGSVDTKSSSFALTVDPTVTTVADLRKLRLSVNGTSNILLSDIANIALRPKPDNAGSYIAGKKENAVPAVNFNVYKKSSANITQAVADAQAETKKIAAAYDGKFTISSVVDTADQINIQYNELIRDMLITVGLVFLTLLIFLGTRQALVASLAIPMTFLISFIVMNLTNISLSFIAFFSLLLSLGLLVDDTIVVISALSAYYRTGKFTPMQAGLLVWRDFLTAISTTTLTTVWAFVPLLLSTGIIGEFIKPIPIVVSSTLLASFGVAMFITLPVIIILLKPVFPQRVIIFIRVLLVLCLFGIFLLLMPRDAFFLPGVILFFINLFIFFQIRKIISTRMQKKLNKPGPKRYAKYLNSGIISFDRIARSYRSTIITILSSKLNRRKTIIIVILFSLFSYLLLPLGFVHNEFFPASDQDYIYLALELPAGTNIAVTNREALKILNDIRHMPDISFATLDPRVGIDPGRGYSSAGDNTALITIVLPPKNKRARSSIDIAEDLRNTYQDYAKGKISVTEVSGGPPAGSDLQIKIFGSDLSVLDNYANKIETYLKTQPGVTNIDKSVKSGTSKIVFTPDYQSLLDAGITQDQAGLWLRTFASGFTLGSSVRLETGNSKSQDIIFRTDTRPQTAESIDTIFIPTQKGIVPLASLGKLSLKPNPTQITRENGKRTLSVTASVTKGYSVTGSNQKLEQFANTLNLPEGYSWQTGGVNQQNMESVNSILEAMLLSFLLIIVTMVLQFSSFRKALIVMLVIPLSISGVFIVFALTNTPLSFPALIGVLALFGIVVKNSILIVDKINQNLKFGLPFTEAIADAAESRLEPIALTSFCAIVGLIPITLSNALWRGLGGAIIAGLFFSGTIMLFFIPVVYYLIFQYSEGKTTRK